MRPSDKENAAECSTVCSQAMMQSGDDKVQSSFPQLSSKNGHTDMNQLDNTSGSRVLRQQRKSVCSIPASVRDGDSCLLEVANGTPEESQNGSCKRSKNFKTTAALLPHSLFTEVYANVDVDVLLTPLSEKQLKTYIRAPRYPVVNDSLSRLAVDSTALPKSSALTSKAKISKPSALVVSRLSKNCRELLTGDVEADVIESTMPKSAQGGRSCSLTALPILSRNIAFVNDDTELDVFGRSFWDRASDRESTDSFDPNVNCGNRRVFGDCRVGNRLKKKSKAEASKQESKARKRKIGQNKTVRNQQRTLQNMRSSTVDKNSKKQQSKAESCSQSGGTKQKGSKVGGISMLPPYGMTLRPRKKVQVDDAGCKASNSSKRQLHSLQSKVLARTRKVKSPSSKIQRQAKNKSKQPKQKVYRKVTPVAASRKRGRVYSKSATPLLLSRTGNNQVTQADAQAARKCGSRYPRRTHSTSNLQGWSGNQTGRKAGPSQKCPRPSRKRISTDASRKPPAKKTKLCKKATVTESSKPYKQRTNDVAATRCSSRLRVVHPTVDQPVTHVARKQSKRARSAGAKTSRSAKQSVNKRVTAKQETEVRQVTSRPQLTENEKNIAVSASNSLQSSQTRSLGDVSSLSTKGKKTRFVDISLSCIKSTGTVVHVSDLNF